MTDCRTWHNLPSSALYRVTMYRLPIQFDKQPSFFYTFKKLSTKYSAYVYNFIHIFTTYPHSYPHHITTPASRFYRLKPTYIHKTYVKNAIQTQKLSTIKQLFLVHYPQHNQTKLYNLHKTTTKTTSLHCEVIHIHIAILHKTKYHTKITVFRLICCRSDYVRLSLYNSGCHFPNSGYNSRFTPHLFQLWQYIRQHPQYIYLSLHFLKYHYQYNIFQILHTCLYTFVLYMFSGLHHPIFICFFSLFCIWLFAHFIYLSNVVFCPFRHLKIVL